MNDNYDNQPVDEESVVSPVKPKRKNHAKRKKIALVILLVVCVITASLIGACYGVGAKQGRSAASVFYNEVIALVPNNDDPEVAAKKLEGARKDNPEFKVPAIYKTLYCDSVSESYGKEVCYFGDEDAEYTILYLHGGSYLFHPRIAHYMYCKELADRLGVRVVMPVYPKSTECTYVEMLEYISKVYGDILVNTPSDKIMVAGDSAGASLSITLCQYLYEHEIAQPKAIFSFSPCGDLAFTNPEIEDYLKDDPTLTLIDIEVKMEPLIGDGSCLTDPLLNPICCEFENFTTEINIFAGTRDFLYPDAERLSKLATDKGATVNFYKYENMIHVFAILPMPESKDIIDNYIASYID